MQLLSTYQQHLTNPYLFQALPTAITTKSSPEIPKWNKMTPQYPCGSLVFIFSLSELSEGKEYIMYISSNKHRPFCTWSSRLAKQLVELCAITRNQCIKVGEENAAEQAISKCYQSLVKVQISDMSSLIGKEIMQGLVEDRIRTKES